MSASTNMSEDPSYVNVKISANAALSSAAPAPTQAPSAATSKVVKLYFLARK
jgi:hypothetical protein